MEGIAPQAKQGKINASGMTPSQIAYCKANKARVLLDCAINGRVILPPGPCIHKGQQQPAWVSNRSMVYCEACDPHSLHKTEWKVAEYEFKSNQWQRREFDHEWAEAKFNRRRNISSADRRYLDVPVRSRCRFCKGVKCTKLCRDLNWATWHTWHGTPIHDLPDKKLKGLLWVINNRGSNISSEFKALRQPIETILKERGK